MILGLRRGDVLGRARGLLHALRGMRRAVHIYRELRVELAGKRLLGSMKGSHR